MIVRFFVDPMLRKRQLLYREGAFPRDGHVKLCYGNRTLQAVVQKAQTGTDQALPTKLASSAEPVVKVSPEVQKALRLPEQGRLHLMQDKESGSFRIGPCLGLYVTREKNQRRMFGEQTRLLEDITRYGREHGVDVVVLTPGFIAEQRGWRYDTGRSRWVAATLTLPDIILRRSGRFQESESKVTADLKAFQKFGRLHSLPRHSSNKWTFYRVMQQNKSLRTYLPATERIVSAKALKTVLRRMEDAYLKPINGAQGICIHRLSMEPGGAIRMVREERVVPRSAERLSTNFRPETKVITERLTKDADIDVFWQSLQGKFRQWVLQESIELLHTTDDRPVDFRWLVQYRDDAEVVGRVARVGARGAITTNLHTGGTAMDATATLEKLPGVDVKETLLSMDTLALAVVKELRTAFGPFAEVGIDIGIDKSGRVVAFEVNPTPGRRMLRSLSDNIRELSLVTLVEYAIRAAGFGNGK